jgi:hypothetical protein
MDVRPFRNPNNVDIFNAIRGGATLDYQRRIPAADKANVQDTIHNLLNFRPQMNEFVDALVNRIGLEIYKSQLWTNPLAKFKRGILEYGDTIEEVMVGLLEARRYNSDRESLEQDIFGQEQPDVQSSFHKVNRQDWYKLTVNEALLKKAFLADYGLSNFVTQLLSTPTTSDNWDEFLLTTSLFKEYYDADGFYKVQVPDVTNSDSTSDESKYLLRQMRSMADTLPYLSTRYNAAGMPVAAGKDELELFITPEANAAVDVEALAGAFNIDKAQFASRQTVIPAEYWPIPGAQAVLSTRDFFVIADQRIETTAAVNPVGLHSNYFLHHWEVISASRFVPAILFTTEEVETIVIADTPVTGVETPTIMNAAGETVTTVARGALFQIVSSAITDGPNDAVRFELEGNESPRTDITQSGMLYVAPDEASESLTVNVFAVDSTDPQMTASVTATVTGDLAILWPNREALADSDSDGLLEVTPEPLVLDADDNVTIPNVVGVQYKKAGVNVNNGSVQHVTESTVFTAVARSGYELAAGATASWTLGA